MLTSNSHDFGPLVPLDTGWFDLFDRGTANYGFTLIMAGLFHKIHLEVFEISCLPHAKLLVRYFDTHQHGDIMSIYTNDIDALRQADWTIHSQLLSSAITIFGVTITMLTVSPLVLDCLFMVIVMVLYHQGCSGKSGRYFGAQQRTWGLRTALLKKWCLVKSGQGPLCMKEKAWGFWLDQWPTLWVFVPGQPLCQCSHANSWELGKCFLCSDSLDRGLFALNGVGGLTIGGLWPFCNWTVPLQVRLPRSQQLNFVPHGLGWWRSCLWSLGWRRRSRPRKSDAGQLWTGRWRNGRNWSENQQMGLKHPRPNGDYQLVKMVGNVVFDDVDFLG